MTGGFYYLATYTASVAAGFTIKDAVKIARAARYAGECPGFTVPEKGADDKGLLQVIFHYLPGDSEEITAQTRPDFPGQAGPLSLAALQMVCWPGSTMLDHMVEYAREGRQNLLSAEQQCQRLGMVAHMVLDTSLHLSFAGVDDPAVNGAAGAMVAAPTPQEGRRELLELTRTKPLAEVFQMEPVTSPPQTTAMGCEQVRTLVENPSAIFTYLSPWRRDPLVSCVNPVRYAGAYLILKDMFRYIRGAKKTWAVEEMDEDTVLDLAMFFSELPNDLTMETEWPRYFRWLPQPPPYTEPQLQNEREYLRFFKYQALGIQQMVIDQCPALRIYERLIKQQTEPEDVPDLEDVPEPEDIPKPEDVPEPEKAEDGVVPGNAEGQEG